MRVDPFPIAGNTDLHPPESKGQASPAQRTPAPSRPSAPALEEAAAASTALPPPERVSVSVDETRELVYKFVDARTGEVLSQIPPEEVLRIVRGIQDLLRAEELRKDQGVNVRG